MTKLRFGMSTAINLVPSTQVLRHALSTVRARTRTCDHVNAGVPTVWIPHATFLEARECKDHVLTFPCYRIKWHPTWPSKQRKRDRLLWLGAIWHRDGIPRVSTSGAVTRPRAR